MRGQPNSFAQHVAAAWREGLTMGAYAKKHGLASSTLYRWQQKLRLTQAAQGTQASCLVDAHTPTDVYEEAVSPEGAECAVASPTVGASKFVALHIACPESSHTSANAKRDASSAQAVVRVSAQKHRQHAPSARLQTRPHPFGQPGCTASGRTHDRIDPKDIDDLDGTGHCTLILPGAIRVQMHAPPEPAWLIALSVCAQGVY